MTDHADDITDECADRDHDRCSGYTEPESDPELCNCPCHDEQERAYRAQYADPVEPDARAEWDALVAAVRDATSLRAAALAAVAIGHEGEAVTGLDLLAGWLDLHPETS